MVTIASSMYGLGISFCVQIAAGVSEFRKAAPHFRIHAAYAVNGGVAVTEIWDNGQDHRAFFSPRSSRMFQREVRIDIRLIDMIGV